MSLMYVTPQEILDFWFSKEVKRHWFEHSEFLDTKVRVMYERIGGIPYKGGWQKLSFSTSFQG